jgi:hypothetical protein
MGLFVGFVLVDGLITRAKIASVTSSPPSPSTAAPLHLLQDVVDDPHTGLRSAADKHNSLLDSVETVGGMQLRGKMSTEQLIRGIRKCISTPPTPETTDYVFTWVNYTEAISPDGYKNMFRKLGTSLPWYDASQTYVELKYILRGLFQVGAMKNDRILEDERGVRKGPSAKWGTLRRGRVRSDTPLTGSLSQRGPTIRNVYVVHQDEHPPRNIFEGTHGQHTLKFVAHSEVWRDTSQLPSANRNGIAFNLHHIPGIAPWFIWSEDDQFPVRQVTLDEFYDFDRRKVKVDEGTSVVRDDRDDGYDGAQFNAARALSRTFGSRRVYRRETHTTHLINTCAMKLADEFWAQEIHTMTGNYEQQPNDFTYAFFSQNMLLDAGAGVVPHAVLPFESYLGESLLRIVRGLLGVSSPRSKEIHSSCTESLVQTLRRQMPLSSEGYSSPYLNLQGWGISDEYNAEALARAGDAMPACDLPRAIEFVRDWYESFFPQPSPFESPL